MIRTVADLLAGLLKDELPVLDTSPIKHAPTIGDMYEGLSVSLLQRAIPEGLGLRIVSGFATDGVGGLSGQLDCMLVQGEGEAIPFSGSFVWHVKDIIAVLEIKKTLHSAELRDAWAQLLSVKSLENNYNKARAAESPDQPINIKPALRAFAETTRRVAPTYEEIDQIPMEDQLIFHTLVSEQTSIIRIAMGLHGFKSEVAFRKAVVDFLESNIGVQGFGPGAFPQLVISGGFSLVKANGRPYSSPVRDGGWWPFSFSTPINPLLLLLELIWTRLDEMFGMSEFWGEDLEVEIGRALLSAKPRHDGDRLGWDIRFLDPTAEELAAIPEVEPWSPAYLTLEEFTVLRRLCDGAAVDLEDPKLITWLEGCGVDPNALADTLLETGLVAKQGSELKLIADNCACAILPTGEYVAAEDNTGRLQRWISRRLKGQAG